MATKKNLQKIENFREMHSSVDDYHCSEFECGLRYYPSDRYQPLESMEPKYIKGIGIELELENDHQISAYYVKSFLKIALKECGLTGFFRFEHDGSLDSRTGIECPSQIATIEYWRNQQARLMKLYDMFRILGIQQTANCGCHVNISSAMLGSTKEQQLKTIARIIRVIEFNFNQWCIKLGRCASRTTYCNKIRERGDSNLPKDITAIYLYMLQGNNRMFTNDHQRWLNLSHFKIEQATTSDRIEIRLPAGMNSAEELIGRLNIIAELIKDAKRMTERQFLLKYC